jgi:hypothetical protein
MDDMDVYNSLLHLNNKKEDFESTNLFHSFSLSFFIWARPFMPFSVSHRSPHLLLAAAAASS